MEVKVEKVDLSVTNNGNIKANIYPEGSDINNIAESIEIIGDECIYLATRKKGETITIETKGKWKNVVIEKSYQEALNSPAYDRIKLLFRRSIAGMNKLANGDRTQVDFDVAKIMVQDNLELFSKTQDFVTEALKKSSSTFAKELTTDLKSKDTAVKYNALKIVNELTQRNLNEVQKDYRINSEPVEAETKKSKK